MPTGTSGSIATASVALSSLEARERGGAVERAPAGTAEHQVFQHAQAGDQQDVLEDGADAERQALARRADAHGPAAQPDLAGVGLVDAGEEADQRRLAGAVLAEQDVDLAGVKIEGYVVVGDYAGIRLGDAVERRPRPACVVRRGADLQCGAPAPPQPLVSHHTDCLAGLCVRRTRGGRRRPSPAAYSSLLRRDRGHEGAHGLRVVNLRP